MTTLREAAQMALDALESWQKTCLDCGRPSEELGRATQPLQILRAALAQPEQEPVAWMGIDIEGNPNKFRLNQFGTGIPLYTAPPQRERILCGCGDQIMPDDGAECGTCVTARNATQREWQGLTDDDFIGLTTPQNFAMKFAEAKLREKNS